MKWDVEQLPSNSNPLLLVDRQENRVIDMRVQSYYTFPGSESRPFQIYYGPQHFIDEHLAPDRIHLSAAYPNPFSQEIALPFTLPPSQVSYQVQMEIFTLTGQRVCTLLNATLSTGFYEPHWVGVNGEREHLPNGVYICELRVDDGQVIDIQRVRVVMVNSR